MSLTKPTKASPIQTFFACFPLIILFFWGIFMLMRNDFFMLALAYAGVVLLCVGGIFIAWKLKAKLLQRSILVEETTEHKTDLANTLKGNSLDDVRKKFDIGAE